MRNGKKRKERKKEIKVWKRRQIPWTFSHYGFCQTNDKNKIYRIREKSPFFISLPFRPRSSALFTLFHASFTLVMFPITPSLWCSRFPSSLYITPLASPASSPTPCLPKAPHLSSPLHVFITFWSFSGGGKKRTLLASGDSVKTVSSSIPLAYFSLPSLRSPLPFPKVLPSCPYCVLLSISPLSLPPDPSHFFSSLPSLRILPVFFFLPFYLSLIFALSAPFLLHFSSIPPSCPSVPLSFLPSFPPPVSLPSHLLSFHFIF